VWPSIGYGLGSFPSCSASAYQQLPTIRRSFPGLRFKKCLPEAIPGFNRKPSEVICHLDLVFLLSKVGDLAHAFLQFLPSSLGAYHPGQA